MSLLLYLCHDDIIQLDAVKVSPVLNTMEEVFTCHHRNNYVLPHKTVLRWGGLESENSRGRVNAMPAYLGGPFDIMGIKWIGSFPNNRTIPIPRATGLIILNDVHTGLPICIMEASYISAMRTAATNLLAAKYLCGTNPETLGLVGAGVQIRFHIQAFIETYPSLRLLKIYNRTPEHVQHVQQLFKGRNIVIESMPSVEDAISDADIVICSTTANKPLIQEGQLKKGVTYFHFSGNECTPEVIRSFNKIYVDDWDIILHRNNLTPALMYHNNQLKESAITGNLGDLVHGTIKGRSDQESILFCSMGMAIEDIGLGYRVYQEAVQKGIGTKIPLWNQLSSFIL